MSFVLTGFADEISPDLEEQLDTLAAEDIHYVELRGVNNKNVLDFTDEEAETIRTRFDEADIHVSAIGSPIGKVKITSDFEEHLQRFRRAMDLADLFGTNQIRLFSYFIPEGEAPGSYRDEVMRRMKAKTALAEERGITLLHENERQIFGDLPERCLDILETVDSPRLRAIWDAANFICCDLANPHDAGFDMLADYIHYLHIKDARLSDHAMLPAGEGDAQIAKTLQTLKDRGFTGFVSLEPHLAHGGQFGGFSGAELFRKASRALKKMLEELE